MIIFMGVAGAGKSAQGRLMADELGLPWLSTGEFLRMLVAGQQRLDMVAGKLMDDKEIITLVRKIFGIIDTDKEFILDGFPRTVAQADWLLSQVKHGQLKVTAVIHLHASEAVVKERLLGRGRQDDNEAAIHERFKEYEEVTMPIVEQFKAAKVDVYEINGEADFQVVHDDIMQHLEKLVV